MNHIYAMQINPELRRKYLDAYKETLRAGLLNPALTPEQRESLKQAIDKLDNALPSVQG